MFDHYSPRVFHIARLFTHSDALAEDIVQDVFMKIWIKRSRLKEVERFDSWVFILSRNVSINALNKIARAELGNEKLSYWLPLSDNAVEKTADLKDVEKQVREAIQLLSGQPKRVFELSRMEGMGREEIARELGLSPNTVKVHLLRATRMIRAYLSSRADLISVLFSVAALLP